MSRIVNKSIRMQEIQMLLAAHPEGLTQAKIAQLLKVNPSTISRNLRDIQAPIYEENGRLFLDRRADLINLHLSLHEALSIHLAARLLATNLDRQNGHAASALRKIGTAMFTLAPQLSRHVTRSALEIDAIAAYHSPAYMRVLETLTEGWAWGQKVKVWYRKTPGEPLVTYTLSPYYIEPGAWGRSTYVIGLREPPALLRTFKIERLEQAELLPDPYEIPPDFDPFALLADAWGIWFTSEPPVQVVLKFSPAVSARVYETRWHPSQQLEPLPGGSLIWRARIAGIQEMKPWIRGWGDQVEVLEPPELRLQIADEMKRAAQNYGWQTNQP